MIVMVERCRSGCGLALFVPIYRASHALLFLYFLLYVDATDNSFLDFFDRSSESAHPVFGRVTDNYDLVVRISRVPTRNDNPVQPVRMIKVRVE